MAVEHSAVLNGGPLANRSVAALISDAMAGLHRTFYGGREPAQVRTYVDGRFICCVLVGPFSSYEKNLLSGAGVQMTVRELWQSFQDAMSGRFKRAITEITDRDVIAFLGQAHADPDLVVLVFELAERQQSGGALSDN